MKVDIISSMGNDLTVANAARVSYGKHHDTFTSGDKKLLAYLADHGHWSPFSHPQITFRISATIQVARQLFRHQVGLAINETSRRYVDTPPGFDLPEVWRKRPAEGESKQGSGGDAAEQDIIRNVAERAIAYSEESYAVLLTMGVAPEQARLVLPMAMLTEWYWTGSLMAFIRICKERLAPDAQSETRDVAMKIYQHLNKLFPYSVGAWGI